MKKTPAENRPPRYPRHRTHPAIMGCGRKDKPKRVIDRGRVMEYVGIGWIEIRKATKQDYLQIPELTD